MICHQKREELIEKANLTGLRNELNALADIFEKASAMIFNQIILKLANQFDDMGG